MAVYIGSGLDITPVLMYKHIKEFTYIDSQPQCEFGMFGYNEKRFYRKTFIDSLNKIMKNNNFQKIKEENNVLVFNNTETEQTITYYTSSSFPEHINQRMLNDLKKATHLIICGYDPNSIILDYMINLTTIIGKLQSCYSNNPERTESPELSTVLKLYEKNYKYELIYEKESYEYWKYENIKQEHLKNTVIMNFDTVAELEECRNHQFIELYD